ncbi:MAG: ribose 5-phosphate isomerase B [Candidatus Cloacimonetes bacterium]|nr:ribose 5-phosphate isomerase B [Candidatus Cloacimonadota bacterium]
MTNDKFQISNKLEDSNAQTPNPKIILASDHAGFQLKKVLLDYLRKKIDVTDFGTFSEEVVDYPDYGFPVGEKVASGEFEHGILICGSGLGMSIVANKVKGIRAALCTSVEIAKLSRQHNDANILVLPGRFMDEDLAKNIVEVWISTDFEDGRHQRRLDKIQKFEEKRMK